MKQNELIQISKQTYKNLVNHLEIHAATDAWAAEVLAQVQADAKPIQPGRTASGAEAAGWPVNQLSVTSDQLPVNS